MIVNTDKKGWEVIYQNAHALLAVQIASCWRQDQRPTRWIETLVAIAEHDDGQADWNATRYLNDLGVPLDFAQQEFSMIQLRRVTHLSQYKGRWIALMVSMHMSFLYEERRGQNQEIDAFLDEQVMNQKKWRRELKVKKEEGEKAYALMQFCDRFSLILCRQELPEMERALEISKGPDGRRYYVTQRADASLAVEPWPFEQKEFSISVEATYLTHLAFENDAQLLQALKESSIESKTWLLRA